MEVAVLHREGLLAYFCPKRGQDFKPSVAPLYPNMGQVPHPPWGGGPVDKCLFAQKLGPNLSEMEVRTFVSMKKVTWDQLLASKAKIRQK